MISGIQEWLDEFRDAWIAGDIDRVLTLFADDVEYHETPFVELQDADALRKEWATVQDQQDISLQYNIYAQQGSDHVVQWDLSYTEDGSRTRLKGIYLITLDDENRCTEFWQYCESPPAPNTSELPA